jgi:8-oxo-dGTP pyrophosphatase MutT (NUDIX family)
MTLQTSGLIRRAYTLVFLRDLTNHKILLGYKKRGFGVHKWNGLGGKVEPGESVYEGALRRANLSAFFFILLVKPFYRI